VDLSRLTKRQLKRLKREAEQVEWRKGNLAWKLRDCQKPLYDAYAGATARKVAWKVSRRFGKSYTLCLIAAETCLRLPNATVHYAAPTAKMVKNILVPIMRQLFSDAPKDLRPTWKKMEGLWRFPNGSVIHMAGVDMQGADNLRGQDSDLFILDEAGFMDALEYVILDIALPQTLTTDGRILAASTPSKLPGHHFTELCAECEATGNFVHKTIYDSSIITEKLIVEYMKESGGEQTSTWKREYLAQEAVDEKNAVIPEWPDHVDAIVQKWEVPKYRDNYTIMDLGFSPDFTFVGFWYWDFLLNKAILQDELILWRMTTDKLADGILEKEHRHFGLHDHLFKDGKLLQGDERMTAIQNNRDAERPHGRYSDIDKQIMHDLSVIHGLIFSPVWKGPDNRNDIKPGINRLRLAVINHEIGAHTRCKEFRKHMKNAQWNELHTDYRRIVGYGHFDGVDMGRYAVRHIDRTRNPYPTHTEGATADTHMIRKTQPQGMNKLRARMRPMGASRLN